MTYTQEEWTGALNKARGLAQEAKELLNYDDWQEHEDYREPLSYDVTTTVRVLLTCGGPTEAIDFDYMDATKDAWLVRARFFTTNNEKGTPVYVDLTDEEAQTLAELYSPEMVLMQ